MILYSVYLLMPLTIFLALFWAPPAEFLGESYRIFYFHVPIAWVSVLAFIISGIFSIIYLKDKDKKYQLLEEKSHNSAILGMIFCILTVITGSIWAKMSWGSYWNWDPRQFSIAILLAIYIAYFGLRSALENNESRGRICSSYLIFAMAMVPIFVFILPRLSTKTLHPDSMIINAERKMNLDDQMKVVLVTAIISFTFLYFYIVNIMNRISFIEKKLEDDI